MIKSIKLRNFQAHEKATCKLSPEVTTIVGRSDAGKSSILRGLRWVALNDPAGEAFIRHGEPGSRVRLEFEDGILVDRTKGSGKNSYHIHDQDKKHSFVSFGSGVPDEVQDVVRLSEVNFQGQYDHPFWLGDTAGEVSRQLNKTVKLDVIDGVLAHLASAIRRLGVESDVAKKRHAEAVEEVDRWSFATRMNLELGVVEKYAEALSKARAAAIGLEGLIDNAKEADREFKSIEIPDLSKLEKVAEKLRAGERRADKLKARLESIARGQEEVERLRRQLVSAEKHLKDAIGKDCPLCGAKLA
jgi:DNA repair exonuclease SbcCD ATPase subunit